MSSPTMTTRSLRNRGVRRNGGQAVRGAGESLTEPQPVGYKSLFFRHTATPARFPLNQPELEAQDHRVVGGGVLSLPLTGTLTGT